MKNVGLFFEKKKKKNVFSFSEVWRRRACPPRGRPATIILRHNRVVGIHVKRRLDKKNVNGHYSFFETIRPFVLVTLCYGL